jgi:Fe-S-cluster formation regulator IscX/YfhJ
MTFTEPPINWNDYEDIALKLHERFEQSNEGHLEMIQSSWVYEWRDNQKK